MGTAGERNAEFVALRVVIFEDRAVGRYDDLEVAVVLIVAANANFEIFGEFLGVVGLAENRDVGDVERDGIRAIVAHGTQQLAIAERVIAGELDVADLNLGALDDFEDEDDGVAGGDAFVLRRDLGKLAAVLAEEFLENDFGFFDARGIETALDGESDFALFEAIENVGFGDGVDAVVTDAADDGALFNFEDDVFVIGTVGRIFDAKLYVFEILGVPESLKIAAKSFFIVGVAFAAEDAGLESVAANAAIAEEDDAIDDGRRILVGSGRGLRWSGLERRASRRLRSLLLRRLLLGSGLLRVGLLGGLSGGGRLRRRILRYNFCALRRIECCGSPRRFIRRATVRRKGGRDGQGGCEQQHKAHDPRGPSAQKPKRRTNFYLSGH